MKLFWYCCSGTRTDSDCSMSADIDPSRESNGQTCFGSAAICQLKV